MKIRQHKYFLLLLLMLYISFNPLVQALYCDTCKACVVNDPCMSCSKISKTHCNTHKSFNDIKLFFEKGKCNCQLTNQVSVILYKVNNEFNFSLIKNSIRQIHYNLELENKISTDLIFHYSYKPIFILNAALLI